MSESLLQMNLNDANYNDVLEKAVFENGQKDSAAYLTAMTKAFFKDGNVEHALKFFEQGIQNRR